MTTLITLVSINPLMLTISLKTVMSQIQATPELPEKLLVDDHYSDEKLNDEAKLQEELVHVSSDDNQSQWT
ncbi:hypothetical protein NDU88_010432 [Pleurodeles waltl]|uniref:Uncharacterized protein n=1 Tax=Pleurodeles waltl TaxID=8319 RepID=A0AAV7QY96_PLEWA|nr:hypothetical protein NDU88_010432 [Pleurodeles waltl]